MVESLPTENMHVVFQGNEGSYSQEACIRFFGKKQMPFMWKASGMP